MSSYFDFEKAVRQYINESDGPFKADACAEAVCDAMPDDPREATKLIRSIERELNNSPLVFSHPDKKYYQSRSSVFNGGEILITPDAFEIENGILFPGDRLTPFASEEVFPSDALLIDEATEEEFGCLDFTAPLNSILPFHILLGSEQVFDYFIADHDVNEGLFSDGAPDGDVTLTVFDFSEFYGRYGFAPGDAIVLRIDSWSEATFSCSFVSARDRQEEADKWVESFTGAMETVIDYFENYLEIPEQVAWGYFFGSKELLESPGASVSEFTDRSDRIHIVYSGGHTVLAINTPGQEDNSPPEFKPPEGVAVSAGETDNLDGILKQVMSPLNQIEVESYCLSELWRRQYDFDSFFKRCFGQEKLAFADDAQEATFMNFIEDIWERAESTYNASLDEIKAPIREQILELIDARVKWFEYTLEIGIDPTSLDQAAIEQMKEINLHLTSMLNLLNTPSHEVTEDDAQNIIEAIEAVSEMQEECIDRLSPS